MTDCDRVHCGGHIVWLHPITLDQVVYWMDFRTHNKHTHCVAAWTNIRTSLSLSENQRRARTPAVRDSIAKIRKMRNNSIHYRHEILLWTQEFLGKKYCQNQEFFDFDAVLSKVFSGFLWFQGFLCDPLHVYIHTLKRMSIIRNFGVYFGPCLGIFNLLTPMCTWTVGSHSIGRGGCFYIVYCHDR